MPHARQKRKETQHCCEIDCSQHQSFRIRQFQSKTVHPSPFLHFYVHFCTSSSAAVVSSVLLIADTWYVSNHCCRQAFEFVPALTARRPDLYFVVRVSRYRQPLSAAVRLEKLIPLQTHRCSQVIGMDARVIHFCILLVSLVRLPRQNSVPPTPI